MEVKPSYEQGASTSGDSATEVHADSSLGGNAYGATTVTSDNRVAPISITMAPSVTRYGASGSAKASAAQSGEDWKHAAMKLAIPAFAAVALAFVSSRRL